MPHQTRSCAPRCAGVVPSEHTIVAAARKVLSVSLIAYGLVAWPQAHAWSDASIELSALPIASVAVAGSAASTAVGASAAAAVTLPAALLVGGAVVVVTAVEVSATGVVMVVERASDGASATLALSTNVAGASAVAVGTSLTTTVLASGVLLSAAGEVIAFVPNAIGEALVYNERL